MIPATAENVDWAIRHNLTKRRFLRVQELTASQPREKLTPWMLLALGMRETWLRNILGGARLVDGAWVPESDWTRQDAGVFQISKRFHTASLKGMEAVTSGTWGPPIEGATAYDEGMVPSFREAVPYVLREMAGALDYARDHHVKENMRLRFAVAAHNAGVGGAMAGLREGNVDKYTTGGDYSGWVMHTTGLVQVWADRHPEWRL